MAEPPTTWWRRRLVEPVLAQLRQGITPEKIALTLAVAAAMGIFPVLGTTTVLCGAAGLLLRLNQPIIQLANYVVYPFQLLLIFPFIRFGEWLYQAPPLRFSMGEMLHQFQEAPGRFFSDFAMTFMHAITAWLLLAPPAAVAVYAITRPLLRAAAGRMRTA